MPISIFLQCYFLPETGAGSDKDWELCIETELDWYDSINGGPTCAS